MPPVKWSFDYYISLYEDRQVKENISVTYYRQKIFLRHKKALFQRYLEKEPILKSKKL